MPQKKNKHRLLKTVGLGTALAAIAGAYYFYGTSEGPSRRKKLRGWMLKAKGEILEKLESAKDMSEEKYHALVDAVITKYGKAKSITIEEKNELAKDLKKHWRNIKKHI